MIRTPPGFKVIDRKKITVNKIHICNVYELDKQYLYWCEFCNKQIHSYYIVLDVMCQRHCFRCFEDTNGKKMFHSG
jgi:hypothetical protein